jgi:hypothetical protein
MCSALTALEFVGQAIQAALGHQDDDPGPPHGIA